MKLKQLKLSYHFKVRSRIFSGYRKVIGDDAVAREALQQEQSCFRYRRPNRMSERRLYDWDHADDRHWHSIRRMSWKDRSRIRHQWQRYYGKESWGIGKLWFCKYRKLISSLLHSSSNGCVLIRLLDRGYALEDALATMESEDVITFKYLHLPNQEKRRADYALVQRHHGAVKMWQFFNK